MKYPLIQQVREKYGITDDMLENCAVTFSMIDASNGLYRIANVPANLVINYERLNKPYEEKYTLVYRFILRNTKISGRFLGEFKIDFLGEQIGCGKITLPVETKINIIISDTITKTTVI